MPEVQTDHAMRKKEEKVTISQSLRDDFELELRKEHKKATQGCFDIADAMAAFDRLFEVAKPLKG